MQANILAIFCLCQAVALLLLWIEVRRQRAQLQQRKASTSVGCLTLDIQADTSQAVARIAELTAALQRAHDIERSLNGQATMQDVSTAAATAGPTGG
jgi:hypothetical protein